MTNKYLEKVASILDSIAGHGEVRNPNRWDRPIKALRVGKGLSIFEAHPGFKSAQGASRYAVKRGLAVGSAVGGAIGIAGTALAMGKKKADAK